MSATSRGERSTPELRRQRALRLLHAGALVLVSSGCPQLLDDGFGNLTIGAGAGGTSPGGSGGATTMASAGAPDSVGGSAGAGAGGTGSTGGTGSVSAGAGGAGATGGASGGASTSNAGGSAGVAGANGGTGGAAGATSCSFGPFSTPQVITGLGRSGALYGPSLSGNGLVLAFSESIDDDPEDIFLAQRDDRDSPFGLAVPATGVNTSDAEGTAFVSGDALTLYFFSDRNDGAGGRDIYRATRESLLDDFGDVDPIDGINGGSDDHMPWLSPDGLDLFFSSSRGSGSDNNLWHAQRAGILDGFETPEEVPGMNTSERDTSPTLTADQRILFFCSDRDGGAGNDDIWMATRDDITGPFGAPEPVPIINESTSELNVALSADGREVIFSSNRDGERRLYRSLRSCL
jgi:hypothetical protein